MISGYLGENCEDARAVSKPPEISLGEGLGKNSKGEICVKINPECRRLKVTETGLSVEGSGLIREHPFKKIVSYNFSYRGSIPRNDFIAVIFPRGNITRVDIQALESNCIIPLKGDYDVELWLNGRLRTVVYKGFLESLNGEIRNIYGNPNLIDISEMRESNTFGLRLKLNAASLRGNPKAVMYLNYVVYVEIL